ncbi:hypothetical protein KIN20_017301 [Parelaphostrongylus tenuis]|uniref:Uncharacterized protein n=1 Tax=Parelaphostrongylus tenuis TaxID=148309 RepID=A0AAD5QNK0_PARTN|nr:hypothetical protein KIN20_017301 [Parelaphostrongylus tenuis]
MHIHCASKPELPRRKFSAFPTFLHHSLEDCDFALSHWVSLDTFRTEPSGVTSCSPAAIRSRVSGRIGLAIDAMENRKKFVCCFTSITNWVSMLQIFFKSKYRQFHIGETFMLPDT